MGPSRAETGCCGSWRTSTNPRSTRRSPASSTVAKFWWPSSTAATSSWSHDDASSPSAAASPRWTPTSGTATLQRHPSPAGGTPRTIPKEEEYSPAIECAQVLQLVQVSGGEAADSCSPADGTNTVNVVCPASSWHNRGYRGQDHPLAPFVVGENPHFTSLVIRRSSLNTQKTLHFFTNVAD